jgi:16S rRNA (cytosine1402-N4)-methyltransferase
MASHEPVMVGEVLAHLEPQPGGICLDCTVGLGGHAAAVLESGGGRLIGLDRDEAALAVARERLSRFGDRVALVHADYRDFEAVLDARGIAGVDGILADLGVSSLQLDEAGRGFSFRHDAPLDMRMDQSTGPTLAEALGTVDEGDLADIIFRLGEERHSRRIARAILRARGSLQTTVQLAEVVRRAVPRRGYSRIDPATRTFQALRIWVNRELEGLDTFVVNAARRLSPGGRLVVLTFHSLEDRIVKHTLRALQADPAVGITVRTRRPEAPSEEEVARNPRARSAKLRAAARTGATV